MYWTLVVGWLSGYGLIPLGCRVPCLVLTLAHWCLIAFGSDDCSVFAPDVDSDLCFDHGPDFVLGSDFFVPVHAARFEDVCAGAC